MSTPSLVSLYKARLADGELQADAAQEQAIAILQDLAIKLDGYNTKPVGLLSRIGFGGGERDRPKGLYLYGDVGRGKSMLMDMFGDAVQMNKKRRVHFHQFMLEIHERLHELQAERVDDVLPQLAKEIAAETTLLCFDEFHVSNIADAMILGRLFGALFDAGVIIIATSNWAPDDLYKNGLQRDRFLPFIDIIKAHMAVHNLNGAVDHRYEQTRGLSTWFSPLGDETTKKLQGIFLQLTNDAMPESVELPVQGRRLRIMHMAKGVGFFNFDELCVQPLGSADFLAIAECLHTVMFDGVPLFQAEKRNETLRFMTLVDALYEAKVKFYVAAAVAPEKLAPKGEHSFAFQRTVSRLMEMQGEEYRRKPHLS